MGQVRVTRARQWRGRGQRILAVAAISASMLLATATPAVAAAKYLSTVVPTKQAKSNWCWAGSAYMVVHHFGGTASQNTIVNYVYPGQNYPNKTATMSQTDSAIDNYCWESGMIRSSSLSWDAVLYQTNNNGPIVTGWGWYGGGGHMIVARGYDDQVLNNYVYWCDPADGLGHKNIYSWFKDNGVHYWRASVFYK